ncbi:MAG: methylated-DNA--[protein]-cysteine S-methyltransferase [Planctomycetia bacterium]|nr:methylated-DNA--[protein]-cysteine S-methyltransferase [Planctomycetia bacterium]
MDIPTIQEELIQRAGFSDEAVAQLREYFAGRRREFTVNLQLAGTPFQKRVWEEMRKIPYGQTVTYQELACRVGNPNAARAVGMACHRNPLPVIVPCHRVVAAHGKWGGYSLGLAFKQYLLEWERGVLMESHEQS